MTRPIEIPKVPEIAEAEHIPLVKELLRIIERQGQLIDALEEEVRRLRGGPKRPRLKPSQLETGDESQDSTGTGKGRGGKRPRGKRNKPVEVTVHETRKLVVDEVPEGSRFKGYRTYTVQDLELRPHNTCFLREQWQTPDGSYLSAVLPGGYQHGHYGPTLVSFILHQYHHNHVTQPLLLEQLHDLGIVISAGQLNRLLSEGHEGFHQEKADLKAAGIATSDYLQTDDTGARHQGRNGYCTYLGNAHFACFESGHTKNRINFLQLLQNEPCYAVNDAALEYMQQHGLAAGHIELLQRRGAVCFADEQAWQQHLDNGLILADKARRTATEGALVGGLVAQGFPLDKRILSDDAGQFDVFAHALCWVHAERGLAQLIPLDPLERHAIDWVQHQLWALYADLKAYKAAPNEVAKATITAGFEALCATDTVCEPLNRVLAKFQRDQAELLLVLEHPELPLHNNLSESDIRDYVKRRKISGGTRSELGRRCRDTFASLKKTCRKHAISFWAYLNDRLSGANTIPSLAELVRRAT